jgi:YVTN family beta-propeller protein
VDPDSIADRTTINLDPASAPTRILQINATEALVTDLHSNSVHVLDLTTNAITGQVDVGGGQPWIAKLGAKAYVITNVNQIAAIDISSKTTAASRYIGDTPMQIVADSARDRLIVFTAGNYAPLTPGKILWVDPSTLAVTDSLILDTIHYYNQLVLASNVAYLLADNGVLKIDLMTHCFDAGLALTKTYFGGYYDKTSGLLYFGTAVDFTNPDVVDIYDGSTLTLKKSLTVGIAPAFFAVVR